MRDALSIFDQLVSFCGNNITYQGVIENLNVLDYEYYFKLVEAFLNGDVQKPLLIFNDVLNKGFDAHHFITGLSAHFRDILVSKDPSTIELLEVGADIGKRYQQQAQLCSPEFIFQVASEANIEIIIIHIPRGGFIINLKTHYSRVTCIMLHHFADNPFAIEQVSRTGYVHILPDAVIGAASSLVAEQHFRMLVPEPGRY